jgi:hypothetical protein
MRKWSVSKWGTSLLICTNLGRVKCLLTRRLDYLIWVVIATFIIFWGLFDIFWGRLLLLPITIILWPIHKRGFGPFTIADMINPQWGLIQWIIYQIIIWIHFSVTLFQQGLCVLVVLTYTNKDFVSRHVYYFSLYFMIYHHVYTFVFRSFHFLWLFSSIYLYEDCIG